MVGTHQTTRGNTVNATTLNIVTEATAYQLLTAVTGVHNVDYHVLLTDTWQTMFDNDARHEAIIESMHNNYEGFEGTEKLTLDLLMNHVARGLNKRSMYESHTYEVSSHELMELVTQFCTMQCNDSMQLTVFQYMVDLTVYCYSVMTDR